MLIDEFENKITQGLLELNGYQIPAFAHLVATLSVPLAFADGKVDFWEEKDRPRYLYHLLSTLDYCRLFDVARCADPSAVPYSILSAALAADRSNVLSAALSDALSATLSATHSAARSAAFSAARYAALSDSLSDSLSAARSAALSAQRWEKGSLVASIGGFQVYLIKCLTAIQEDKPIPIPDCDWYGPAWANFLSVLSTEECDFWAQRYRRFFGEGKIYSGEEALLRIEGTPEEIIAKGAAAVGHYWERMNQQGGARRLNEARLLILGDKGVGKTTLARKLVNPVAPLPAEEESTMGVDTSFWDFEGDELRARIWDFAGHAITHAVHRFFLSERCLYVLVYDGRMDNTQRLFYWLDHMKNYGGDSEAILVVNLKDPHKPDLPINSLKEEYNLREVYWLNLNANLEMLENLRTDIHSYIKDHPAWSTQRIGAADYRVKAKLESLFDGKVGEPQEHLAMEEFKRIAQENEAEEPEQLLQALHALGISFWYPDITGCDTLILNPDWITDGFYAIVNWLANQNKHGLTLKDLKRIFASEAYQVRYPESQHTFLCELLKNYEMAFQQEGKDYWVVPHLLKEDRPEKIPEFAVGESLLLRYQAEISLPAHTISRFMVRHHMYIKRGPGGAPRAWRYGVLLESQHGAMALVREYEHRIDVSVKGPQASAFLEELRATLNDLFQDLQSQKPDLLYRVKRFGELPDTVEERNPIWLKDRQILGYAQSRQPYYDEVTGQPIPLQQTVNNYSVNNGNLIAGSSDFQNQTITFNFRDCSISLQGELTELSDKLFKAGEEEDAEDLKELVEALEDAEELKEPALVRKKLGSRFERWFNELSDINSSLHQRVKKVRKGMEVVQRIASGYNDIAQWVGLPQVPTPLLGKVGK